ncbi:MAG TPA: F0F1 ATP synthase subunit alpha, partial [Actinomycetota bacterium]|nr:F0F1 ATP synthase subunit alpha [Actinomycetota bacterium]
KAMKQVAGRLRLDLAQYRELEAFATFGSELDKTSQAQLDRGARVVEVLKQPQYSPMSVEQQVMVIFAVTNGFLDDLPVPDAKRFESELLDYLGSRQGDLGKQIAESGELSDELADKLRSAIKEFRSTFQPSEGAELKEAEAEPLSEEELERLKKFRRPTEEEYREKAGPAGEAPGTPGPPG